ncbi:hypothetical protein AGLY_009666, partial [Aphis glycines]
MLNVSQSSSVTSEFKTVKGENVTTTPRDSISHNSKGASGISRETLWLQSFGTNWITRQLDKFNCFLILAVTVISFTLNNNKTVYLSTINKNCFYVLPKSSNILAHHVLKPEKYDCLIIDTNLKTRPNRISQNVLEPKGRACDVNWVFNWLLSRLSNVCINCSCNSVKGECST